MVDVMALSDHRRRQFLPGSVILLGLSVYRWEINIRDSTVLGFVGAGGIGVQLFRAVDAFAWGSVSMILLAILGIVIVSEAISKQTRGMVR